MKLMFPSNIVITDSNVAGSSYSTWDSATAYTIGQNVYLSSNYGEYEALTNNTNKPPNLNPTDWKFLGTANKYKMFDQYLNTQTSNTGTIDVDIVAYGSTGLYLGNIDATTVNIQVVDNDTLSVIENNTYEMYRDVDDWLDYFYGTWIDDKEDFVMLERSTLTQNISYLLTVDNGTSDAKCGIFFAGIIREIGKTKYGVSIGALDYSAVAIDTSSGATYLSRGNYAKTLDVDIFAHTSSAKAVYSALVSARGLPVVFVGEVYDLLTVYGYIQKHETLLNGPVETAINVQVIGLI